MSTHKYLIILFLFLGLQMQVFAAFEYKDISAYSASCAGVRCLKKIEPMSIFYMPSRLAKLNKIQVQTFHTSLFNMIELPYNAMAFSMPIKNTGTCFLGYTSFGTKKIYQERVLMYGYSRKLSRVMQCSVVVKHMSLFINDAHASQNKTNIFGCDFSCSVEFDNVTLGLMAVNINRPVLGKNYSEELYRDFSLGLSYSIKRYMSVYLESFKIISYKLGYRLGIESSFLNFFTIRSGMQINPARYSAGFGLTVKLLTFDYAYSFHPYLSGQHMISMGMTI